MATSSITKEFYIKDPVAFEQLKKNWGMTPSAARWSNPLSEEGQRKISHPCFSFSKLMERALDISGLDRLSDALDQF